MKLANHVVQFFRLVADGGIEIYNEFSLQHEFGIYLRSVVPSNFKVRFELPVGFFDLKVLPYEKKEIDIAAFSSQNNRKLAIELKFPRNGQYPEQMFEACRDISFLEQLVEGGFSGGAFVMTADDPLFFSGNVKNDLYACFRAGRPIHGVIQKPTGAKDHSLTISGTHTINWVPSGRQLRFSFVSIGDDNGP